ncbi:MAG: hypothetical protein K6G09_04510 [Treponema sp.]|nr:hypothetical protein [Treponema sp.]
MKKKIIFGSTLLALVLCIFGCNFQLPESIAVKSNAKYEFAIANKSFPLGDLFSIDKIRESFSGDSSNSNSGGESVSADMQIYDYNPDKSANEKSTQKFLINMKLQEIPLNLDEYLADIDFDSSFDSMNINKEIEIPNVDINEDKVVDVEVNEKINALVSFRGTTQETAPLSVTFNPGNGFNNITYKTGYMVISNTPDLDNVDFGQYGQEGFTLPQFVSEGKLTGAVKLLYNGNVISEATFDDNGLARLPLNNVTVYVEGMSLNFTGGENGKTFYALVSQDSQVKSANGISFQDPIDSTLEASFDIGNDSALKSCEIAEGSLAVEFSTPEEWSGIEIKTYQIDLTGGLNVTLAYDSLLDGSDSTRKEFDFAAAGVTQEQKTFVNTDITANTAVSIKMTNANLQFIDDNDQKINPVVKVEVKIEEVASALVVIQAADSGSSETQNTEESFNTRIEDSKNLDSDILKSIRKIKWNPSGLSISYLNTLPSSNELKLKFSSDFFDITDKVQTFGTTTAETRKTMELFCADEHETLLGTNAGEFSTIDYAAELILPDYEVDSEGNKTIIVRDVVPGETYVIDLVITPKPDWYAVYVKSDLTNQSGNISTGLNLSSVMKGMQEKLGDDLSSKIKIETIPLYLFCQIPEIANTFNNTKFVGKINAYIGDDNKVQVPGTDNVYLLGSETETGTLTSSSIPELTLDPENRNMVISNLSTDLTGIEPAEMSTLIDTTANGSLCVDYNVHFETGQTGDIEVLATNLKNIPQNTTSSIKLSGLIILSLDFTVTEPISMDILELVKGSDEEDSENSEEEDSGDLLGRKEATNTEDFQKYLDLIESASIDYKTSSLPFNFDPPEGSNNTITIKVDLDGEGTTFEPKVLKFDRDSFAANPSDILNTFPLKPSVQFEIPEGILGIPRKMDFTANINLTVKTNGKVAVWEKNAKNGGEE